ncbi:hypothetical protein HGRIS_007512 [Hohenbuehelia grisea]|uniref:Uncharacterized protein n=1 Tax=Hohenbuehelia grisea TaxID=104357 RepID=A0ABR3J5E2_9AGAR
MRYSVSVGVVTALAGTTLAAPHTTWHAKRAQTYTCGTSKIPLRVEPGGSRDISQQTCLDVNGGNAPHYKYTDGQTAATVATTTTAPPDTTCEHIMEIQMLKQVLESAGGPCDQLAKAGADDKQAMRAKFKQVTDIINSAPNLVFADNTLEKQKGDMVNKAQSGRKYKNNPKKPDANLKSRLTAVDHFVNSQTRAASMGVASALDAKIAELFPGTKEKVSLRWSSIMSYASTSYADLQDGGESCELEPKGKGKKGKRAVKKGGKKGGKKTCHRKPTKPGQTRPGKGKPKTGVRKPGSRKPKPGARKPKGGVRKPKAGARKPKPGARKPKGGVRKPKGGARKPKGGVRKPKGGARKPKAVGKPKRPASKPKRPAAKPKAPARKPKRPASKPKAPARKPKAPARKPKAAKPKGKKKGGKREELDELLERGLEWQEETLEARSVLPYSDFKWSDNGLEGRDIVWDVEDSSKRAIDPQDDFLVERDLVHDSEDHHRRGQSSEHEVLEQEIYMELESLD